MEEHLQEIQSEIKNNSNAKKDSQDRTLVNYSFDASWQLSRTARNSPSSHATAITQIQGEPKIFEVATRHRGIYFEASFC